MIPPYVLPREEIWSTLSHWNQHFNDMRKQSATPRVSLRYRHGTYYISMVSYHLRCVNCDDTSTFAAGILIASMLFLNATLLRLSMPHFKAFDTNTIATGTLILQLLPPEGTIIRISY
jgi:hypothetical protein